MQEEEVSVPASGEHCKKRGCRADKTLQEEEISVCVLNEQRREENMR
ncbi:MAG: hypothetical protein HFH11_11290 [Dorea sp.]|nr:hypothetical protein [Dorea sp.]